MTREDSAAIMAGIPIISITYNIPYLFSLILFQHNTTTTDRSVVFMV